MSPRSLLRSWSCFALFLVVSMSLVLAGCDQSSPTSATSLASPSFKSTNRQAAVVIRNSGCSLIDGDGAVVLADRDITIATQSANQNTTLICTVKKVANSTGHVVHYDSQNNPVFPGIECSIIRPDVFVFTTDWRETVSAAGNATLRCRFKQLVGDSVGVATRRDQG